MSSRTSRLVCQSLGRLYNWLLSDFPPIVRIETTNACNARCTICPHREMRRPIVTMEESLFRGLIDQCSAAKCPEVHLHNFGEPMMDKNIADRIAYAKQQGIAKVKIFCNGSLLTAERAKRLIDAGLDEIKVSFDGATREEFERIREPLKYDAVVANVMELVKLRDAMKSKMRIRVACCSTTDKNATMKLLAAKVDDFSFGKLHNWGTQGVTKKRIRNPCTRLWRTFTVLAGGEVALCCLDYDGIYPMGRVDDGTSIREVWHGPNYRELRRIHRQARQKDVLLCANCTKSFL